MRSTRTIERQLGFAVRRLRARAFSCRCAPWFLIAVTLGLLATPGRASAHLRSGTVAVDYRVTVARPVTAAYEAQIYQSDHGLSLTLKPGHTVVLLGYLGEPVFRLDGAGLWVNAASPTAAATRLVPKAQQGDSATPAWRLQAGKHSVVWHDGRAQGLPAGVDRGVWKVPLIVDRHRTWLEGELQRFGAPDLWLWLGVLACLLVAGGLPLAARRRDLARRAARGCALVAAGASVLLALAFALDSYASPGTWIEGFDAIAFLAVGLWAMVRGPENLRLAGALGMGLVSLAIGLLDGAVFLHPIVLAILPGTIIRLLAVTAIGAGLSAAALGVAFYEEFTAKSGNAREDLGFPRASPAPGVSDRRGGLGA